MSEYMSLDDQSIIHQLIMDAENACKLEEVEIRECGEPLVLVPAEMSHPWYHREMGLGSDQLYVRASVMDCLRAASEWAGFRGYSIKVLDGYRSNDLQQELFRHYMLKFVIPRIGLGHTFRNAATPGQISMIMDDLPREIAQKIHRETSKYVAVPSEDPKRPANHRTGGAVDVWLYDENEAPCDLGCEFDHMDDPAHTFYHLRNDRQPWPSGGSDKTVLHNREMLLDSMWSGGEFTPYPYEFWHFDYGNQRYGRIMKLPAQYGAADHLLPTT